MFFSSCWQSCSVAVNPSLTQWFSPVLRAVAPLHHFSECGTTLSWEALLVLSQFIAGIFNWVLRPPDKTALHLLHNQPGRGCGTCTRCCCIRVLMNLKQAGAASCCLHLCNLPPPHAPIPSVPPGDRGTWVELSHKPLFLGGARRGPTGKGYTWASSYLFQADQSPHTGGVCVGLFKMAAVWPQLRTTGLTTPCVKGISSVTFEVNAF